ncbi:MAG: carboxypeptidase-like regulatory domain-containing protein, partial [Acidobacteria bacterium]|nr:carboxypeptidase-like regulatory domain-containing protein [Acidobacteriota bacterium]
FSSNPQSAIRNPQSAIKSFVFSLDISVDTFLSIFDNFLCFRRSIVNTPSKRWDLLEIKDSIDSIDSYVGFSPLKPFLLRLKGGRYMKKAINILIAGCMLGAVVVAPASITGFSSGIVEASPSLALVTGTVKDVQGTPLVGAVVALLQPHPRGREIKSVKTDTQGKFSADIAPGIYRLRASAEGFVAQTFARVNLDRPVRVTYDFQLRRTDTLVQKRGDSDDYRWIARSVPRHVLNLREDTENGEEAADKSASEDVAIQDSLRTPRPSFHGMTQLIAVSSASQDGLPGANFFGTNFAFSGTLPGNVEMALIGQRGVGYLAPQRLSAIATVRPNDRHQVTASIGYGQVALARKMNPEIDASDPAIDTSGTLSTGRSLDQLSVTAVGSWQVFRPLLIIYGFDYSRFLGSANSQNDSVVPRFAVQYAPSSRLRLNAAVTPGSDQYRNSLESFNTENIQATFEDSPPYIAFNDSPILDRSRRFEVGIERLFGDGDSSLEGSAFYDLISGHGVGVLALPLEASPETQATIEQVAHQVTAMNGAARGIRVIYRNSLDEHVTASVGYSFGRGTSFNTLSFDSVRPAEIFRGGFFQVATAKLDLDFTHETGTRISTVIRLSPSAVVFAIDPFAGRLSVYDPNINVYVTQDLPNFGLPVRWQALVDVRNLLDQTNGVEDGMTYLIAARTRRTVRGGLSFRW